MKVTLRIIGLVGFLLFSSFFGMSFGVPGYVEEVGKDFIKQELQDRTNEKIDRVTDLDFSSSENKVAKLAGKLLKRNEEQLERLRSDLKSNMHVQLAAVIAEMRDLDCECRKKYENWIKQGYESQIISLEKVNEKLLDFMKAKYMQVANELKRDVRIFTGSNAVIFLLLILVSFFKPRAIAHLFLPAILLTVSTLVIAFFYIFEQNWLMTIIYSDYWGFAYLGYVGVLFLFLCDIVFNSARVTTEIINGLLNALGQAATMVPC